MTDVQGVRRLAAKLVKYDERLLALEAAPQLGHSSVNIGGEDYVIPDLLGVLRENDEEVREAMAEVAADLASAEETLRLANEELADARQELTGLQTELDTARDDITAANEELAQAKADLAANEQAVADAQQAVADAQAEVAAIGNVAELAQALADEAKNAALAAQTSADGKSRIFYQADEPAMDPRAGDTWFKTDEGNKIHRYNGSAWVAVSLDADALASSVADTITAASETAQSAANDASQALTTVSSTVKSVSTQYALGTSGTQAPTSGWSATSPTLTSTTFIWMRQVTTYVSGSTSTGTPVRVTGNAGVKGDPGADGAGISIAGTVSAYANLPANLGASDAGKAYLLASDGKLYIWDGAAWPANGAGVAFRGPEGEKGDPGADGTNGAPGADGASLASITPYYRLVGAGTAAPSKPTTKNPSGWTTTEPGFQSSTDLYRSELVIKTDESFAWTPVTKVSVNEGAKEALTAANLAAAAADGKVKASRTDPGHDVGRIWLVLNTAGDCIGIKISDGAAWSSYALMADQLIVPSSLGATSIKDGAITTAKVAANAITANEIKAGTITAASGIIADAAITTAKVANLDAAKITTGTLDAARIAASSITAEKIALGDFTNLVSGSDFENAPLVPWDISDPKFRLTTGDKHSGTQCLIVDPPSAGGDPNTVVAIARSMGTRVEVKEGEQLYIEVWAKAASGFDGTASNSKLSVRGQSGSLVGSLPLGSDTLTGSWVKYTRTVTIPSGTTSIYFDIRANHANGTLRLDDIVIRRMATAELIVDGSITSDKIAANAITAREIKAGEITTAALAANAVTAAKIAAGTITASKIVANAITSDKIVSNAITADKIVANAVTAEKIVALSIGADHLAVNSVTADKIVALAVTADKIAANAVTANKIVSNAITAGKIASNAVTAAKIAANAITAAKIAGGAIDGMVITGATLRTAASGPRIEMFLNRTDVGNWPMLAMFGPDSSNPLASLDLGGGAGQNYANLAMYDGGGAVQAALTMQGLLLANDGEITLRAGSGGLNDAVNGQRYGRIYRPLSTGGIQIDGGSDQAGFASLRMDNPGDGARVNFTGIYGRTNTASSNVFVSSAGTLNRSTSLKKAKVNVQDQGENLGLLGVSYRSWIDKQNMIDTVFGRRADPGPRVVGVVAEELEKLAPELCVYGDDGALQGVAYDRVGPALIPIIRGLVSRIERLEGGPATVWPDSPIYDDTELLDEITAYGADEPEAPIPAAPSEEVA